jgi:hypothetical protein
MNSSRRRYRPDHADIAEVAKVPVLRVAPGPRPHLLVALAAQRRARVLDGFDADVVLTVVEPQSAGKLVWPCAPVDVAVVAPEQLDSFATPLFGDDPLVGFPEVVFVIGHVASAQRFALERRGYPYVVLEAELGPWLAASLDQLCTIARTRRQAMEALARRPSAPPLPHLGGRGHAFRLHAAEASFRETYLRLLLAEHGSRRKAAAAAGLPYRSFCDMVRRAGI